MKILSNFDTHAPLEDYKKAIDEFGPDKVIFIRRHKIYLTFYVVLPFVGIALMMLVLFFSRGYLTNDLFGSVLSNTLFFWVFLILFLIIGVHGLFNYINYLLDYTIITPSIITFYNQTGIFKREIDTIETIKIKSVVVSENSLLESLFNYGALTILSEGDEADAGDITLHFIHRAPQMKEQIMHLIDIATS